MADLDRLIQTLYYSSFEDEWVDFRVKSLAEVSTWLGASGAAWLTRSSGDLPGEFTDYPKNSGVTREQLTRLRFGDGEREMDFSPLPAELSPNGLSSGREQGHILNYIHRGGALTSLLLLRYPSGQKLQHASDVRRAIGHMVEAGSLALKQFIQRDEWLYSLGRPSRGTAALVDARGAIYAASSRFRDLIAGEFGDREFYALPQPLPLNDIDNEEGFFMGPLHFRAAREGNLYLLHARRPLPMDALSPREQQVARALGSGRTFKSVARTMGVAVSTVANHASRIYKKLGIFRREELMELVRPRSTGSNQRE